MANPPYHPELTAAARWLPRGAAGPWQTPVLRRLVNVAFAVAPSRSVRVDAAGTRVYVYRPQTAGPHPALLWMHGGGLVFGDARQHETWVRPLVEQLGVVVASVQYRLAPAHPFPAPIEDCARALTWRAEQPDVDATRIAVGGNSAGGGLAASLCQWVRDRGGPQPVFQLLVYPMLDDRSSDSATVQDGALRLWNRDANRYGWSSYLRGWPTPPPHAVPARTEDLSGLPPAWIGVGDLDLFYEEDIDYARRLEQAGVAVQLERVAGAFHGFDVAAPKAAVSQRFHQSQREALAAALGVRVAPP